MQEPKPYAMADRAIATLTKTALRLVVKAKQRLLIEGFDELNVLNRVDALYSALDGNNRKLFKQLYIAKYIEILAFYDADIPDEDTIDELAEMYLAGLLGEPNYVTHYVYDAEILRKRDRAKEAINSTQGNLAKQLALDKALKQWLMMTGWYVDIVEEDAMVDAMRGAGIKRVMRHEREDEKTCQVCRDADGEIYDINKIPPKPHLHCRRWFTAVR